MDDLRRNRQALTATVFQEGRPLSFEDNVLKIEFPADSDFHAGEARKSRHGDALRDLLEEHFGVRPRLECQVTEGSSGAPASLGGELQEGASSQEAEGDQATGSNAAKEQRFEGGVDGPAGVGEGSGSASEGSGAAYGRGASARVGTAPDATGPDDTIRSEDEIFEMARERFGPRGPIGGS